MSRWEPSLRCRDCGHSQSVIEISYRCPACGGIFSFDEPPVFDPAPGWGMARYRRSLPLPEDANWVSLGEGDTPLVAIPIESRNVHFKCEHLNPTGSFKDRGASVLVSALAEANVTEAFDDSSGNAGAAFAAYAARAGIKARVLVPGYASGPKRDQIAAYSAELVAIDGPRSAVTRAAEELADTGGVYASHATLPHVMTGSATIAYELFEQLGGPPGGVITPVGQGTLLLGLALGFESLVASGRIKSLPKLVGVQAKTCAPIEAAFAQGVGEPIKVPEGETAAEGIRITNPYRGDEVLRAVNYSAGRMLSVPEQEIMPGRDALAAVGLYVEPTSAVVWAAIRPALAFLEDPVVVVLTGSGLKYAP
jgi:threonine synthase